MSAPGGITQPASRYRADRLEIGEIRRITLAMIEKAAAANERCPTNTEIARAVGGKSMNTGSQAIARLEAEGLIAVERGNISRVVTIVASGARTAGKVVRQRAYGPGSRPPTDPDRRERRRAAVSIASAGHVTNPPYPEHRFVSRDPCGWCNTRRDIGCRHHPLDAHAERQISPDFHAGDMAQGDGRIFASDRSVNLTRAEIA